jgi:cobalt-zinc-cadmium efflux system membrane fusion protein
MKPIFALTFLGLMLSLNASAGPDDHGHHDEGHNEEAQEALAHRLDDGTRVHLSLQEATDGAFVVALLENDGEPVASQVQRLSLRIERLGRQPTELTMQRDGERWRSIEPLSGPHSFDAHVSLNKNGQTHQWTWANHEGRIRVNTEVLPSLNLATTEVGPGIIADQLHAHAQLEVPPDQRFHVRARFPGLVTDVMVNVGDQVETDQPLLRVESNESLQSYTVTAPGEGKVVAVNTGRGDTTRDAALVAIHNTEQIWAAIRIYPRQRQAIQTGQPVTLQLDTLQRRGEIAHIVPAHPAGPYLIAHVPLDNRDQTLAPGDTVDAHITLREHRVELVVPNRAIQQVEGREVVFIAEGNLFEARPVTLGRRDAALTEVLSGLLPGETVVTGNSYVLKADLEKAGAAHAH